MPDSTARNKALQQQMQSLRSQLENIRKGSSTSEFAADSSRMIYSLNAILLASMLAQIQDAGNARVQQLIGMVPRLTAWDGMNTLNELNDVPFLLYGLAASATEQLHDAPRDRAAVFNCIREQVQMRRNLGSLLQTAVLIAAGGQMSSVPTTHKPDDEVWKRINSPYDKIRSGGGNIANAEQLAMRRLKPYLPRSLWERLVSLIPSVPALISDSNTG